MKNHNQTHHLWWSAILLCLICQFGSHEIRAEVRYSPADIFAITEYAQQLTDRLLAQRHVTVSNVRPRSQEMDVKPMHVYELYVAVLIELYNHELTHQRTPPPLVAVAPINYTPTETYQLAMIVIAALEELYQDEVGPLDITRPLPPANKTPAEVYQAVFELYVSILQINGKPFPTLDDIYAQFNRATEDLKVLLITLSKRLPNEQEPKKRLLITAAYGINPNGTHLSALEPDKKPADVLVKVLTVRDQLNGLRKHFQLPEIRRPELSAFTTVTPADVFLQTQIIIAELNIIKMSQQIHSITNLVQPATGKQSADHYQELKRIEYMLDRLTTVLR